MSSEAFIAQSMCKEILSKSSSGGMFAELAKHVLAKKGVVFGCAMERTQQAFEVKHICIDNENDLYKLQGSKYVQSYLGDSIKQAKYFLEQGRFVLFSGTPCQIAGLKLSLKKDYANLLTVDISCEGTPSLKMFNDYVQYLEKYVIKHKIVDLKFRPKEKCGWTCNVVVVVVYEDGDSLKEKVLYTNLSSYFTCFFTGDILQDRCFKCKYTGLKRNSDITIADAWGVEKEYPEYLVSDMQKTNGISLVLINSERGKEFFNNVNKHIIFRKIDANRLAKYNHPLRHPSIERPERKCYMEAYQKGGYIALEKIFRKKIGKKYYYYAVKNHTPKFIKEIIKRFFPKNVDCLLMTMYNNPNYGSLLTSFALYKTLSNLGYNIKLIHYGNISLFCKNFIKKYLPLTFMCINSRDFSNLNNLTNTFILGSDNLMNLNTLPIELFSQNLLNFTSADKKRLIISGSIGDWQGYANNKTEQNYIKYLLNRFDYISMREDVGVKTLNDIFNIKADWINDPVFYINKQEYIDLTQGIKQDYSNNIMSYILYPTCKSDDIVSYYQEQTKCNIVKFDGNKNAKNISFTTKMSVENWLSAIINSKLVITDSFHCVAFCLIFNKDFVCIKNSHAVVRFTSLFKRLGINIPLVETVDDLTDNTLTYDKVQVNAALEEIKAFALERISQEMYATKKNINSNKEMETYNQEFIKNNTVWYRKNKLFYYAVIRTIIFPLKMLLSDLKRFGK